MTEELELRLNEKYPKIFQPTPFHFECSDGWYDLIDTVCSNIQSHVDQKRMSKDLGDMNDEEFNEEHQTRAAQVKEKFGGLRFYVDGGDDYIYGIIALAESMSYRICESCGSKGSIRRGPWIRTLCDGCDQVTKR